MSEALYVGLVAAVALERVAELRVARRHAAWSFARGGVEHGRGHYPVMVVLHTAFLASCVTEVLLFERPFRPALGAAMGVALAASQGVRWWCIAALGPRWSTRVIVVPGLAPVEAGPYRWLRHPNYAAVAVEGVALPLLHGAWATALAFTLLNAPLLWVRIRCEEAALEAGARRAPEAAA